MVSLLLCGCAAIALAAAAPVSLNSGRIQVTFGERGISAVGMLPAPPKGMRSAQDEGHGVAPLWSVDVVGDDFSVSALVGPANSNTTGKLMTIRSSGLAAPSVTSSSDTNVTFTWRCGTALSCNVLYSLPFGATSVTKSVSVHHTTTAGAADAAGGGTASATATANVWNVTDVAVFADVSLTLAGSSSADTITSCSHYGLGDYALFERWGGGKGAMLSAQNPYLRITTAAGKGTTVGYAPMLLWAPPSPLQSSPPAVSAKTPGFTSGSDDSSADGFYADAGVLGVYGLTGRYLFPPADKLDEAEQAAMVAAVKAELVVPQDPTTTVKINIAWTENDYELDIATEDGRTQYKRIIDRAADFGITHVLFAPQNSDVSDRANNTDAWGWEQLLWFGMGQKIRMGYWKPGDALPDSLTEMLAYFKLRGVKPVAYVYPILAFLAGTLPGGKSPPWIVPGVYDLPKVMGGGPARLTHGEYEAMLDQNTAKGNGGNTVLTGPLRANLASPEFQEWLPRTMAAFAKATGAGGFSFDYTYFEEPESIGSQYAQWAGWRSILHRLHIADGGKACAGGTSCVVDNRQQNHVWGPWMWAQGGTYAEPLMSDEQPGSWMFYEADLHTDRLSANEERFVAWNYRQLEFCPNEVLPGFAFHQTDRDPSPKHKAACPDARCSNSSRARDFDFLGYRYSLLSSVGTAGLNNVLNMLPARDIQEETLFPKEDSEWVSNWMQWTDQNVELLQKTRVLPNLPQPTAGKLDGVVMVDNNNGAMFVYNPTAKTISYSIKFDEDIGFDCSTALPVIVRLMGSSDRGDANHNVEVVECGAAFNITVPPTTALAYDLDEWGCVSAVPQVFGATVTSTTVTADGKLELAGVSGPAGSNVSLFVAMPPGTVKITSLSINGAAVAGFKTSTYRNVPTLTVEGRWDGDAFGPMHEIGTTAGWTGGDWAGTFNIPSSVMEQLAERNKTYPIKYDMDPLGDNDPNVPWLAPGRLLIFAKYKPLLNDTFNATGTVDGKPIIVRKGYNTIVRSPQRFIGYWADVTEHIVPGTDQELKLTLPSAGTAEWIVKNGALLAGSDIVTVNTTVAGAEKLCKSTEGCSGFTWSKPSGSAALSCQDAANPSNSQVDKMYLKSTMSGNADGSWCTVVLPSAPVGIFFENVQTIFSQTFAEK